MVRSVSCFVLLASTGLVWGQQLPPPSMMPAVPTVTPASPPSMSAAPTTLPPPRPLPSAPPTMPPSASGLPSPPSGMSLGQPSAPVGLSPALPPAPVGLSPALPSSPPAMAPVLPSSPPGMVPPSSALPPPLPGEKVITIQEAGKPPLKCRVVQSWQTAEGAQAHQVQALETGEIMTILENAPGAPELEAPGVAMPETTGSHTRALVMRIFHWSRSGMAPEGTPMPPMMPNNEMAGMQPGSPSPMSQAEPASGPGSRLRNLASRIFHRGDNETVVEGSPTPGPGPVVDMNGQPVQLPPQVVQGEPAPSSGGPLHHLASRIFHRGDNEAVAQGTPLPGPGMVVDMNGQPINPSQTMVQGEPSPNSMPFLTPEEPPSSGGPLRNLASRILHRGDTQEVAEGPTLPGPVPLDQNGHPLDTTMPFVPAEPAPASGGPLRNLASHILHHSDNGAVAQGPPMVAPNEPSSMPAESGGRLRNLASRIFHPADNQAVAQGLPVTPAPPLDPGTRPTEPSKQVAQDRSVKSIEPSKQVAQDTKTSNSKVTSALPPSAPAVAATGDRLKPQPAAPTSGPASGKPPTTWPPAFADQTARVATPVREPASPFLINPPAGCSGSNACPCCTNDKPAESSKTPLLSRVLHHGKQSGETLVAEGKPTPEPPVAQASVEPAQPGDWRQSWGKVDTVRAPETAHVETPHKEKPKAETAKTDAVTKETPKSDTVKADTGKTQGTKTDTAKTDSSKGTDTAKAEKPADPQEKKTDPARIDLPKPWEMGHTDKHAETASAEPLLPHADSKRSDPLKEPESYSRLGEGSGTKPATGETTARPSADTKGVPASVAAASAAGDSGKKSPLGMQSVMEAGSPRYVPVPIVTMPDVRRMPAPPPANVPQAPEPNAALMANAFTTPQPPSPPPLPPNSGMANAFTTETAPVPSNYGAFMQNPAGGQGMGMYPPGYGGYGGYAGYAGYQGYAGYRGPVMYPQGMSPGVPYAAVNPAVYQQYAGTAGQPMQQVAYQQPMAGYPVAGWGTMTQSLTTLHDSLFPSQRELAADKLAGADWRTHADVVDALVTAAREDPAPTVRAACVRALGKMKANTMPVVSTLQALKTDGDPRVLHEVEEALAVLAPTTPSTPARTGGQGTTQAH